VNIRAKSPKIRAKCEEIWEKYVQTSTNLLHARLFCKNGTQNESEDVFLEVIFFQIFFGQVCGNLGKNSSHTQKFACSYNNEVKCQTEAVGLHHLSESLET